MRGWGNGEAIGPRVQDLRALPCEAGGALCWTGRLLHFGGRCGRYAEVPRIALACAVSAESTSAECYEVPQDRIPLDGRVNGAAARAPLRMPTIEERLSAISTQRGQYDGPYENGIQLSTNTRRLLFSLNQILTVTRS